MRINDKTKSKSKKVAFSQPKKHKIAVRSGKTIYRKAAGVQYYFNHFTCQCGNKSFYKYNELATIRLRCCQCGKEFRNIPLKSVVLDTSDPTNRTYTYRGPEETATATDSMNNVRLSAQSVLIRTSVFCCTSDNHELQDVVFVVPMINLNSIFYAKVPGAVCLDCNRYYLLETDYKELSTKGTVLCDVTIKDFLPNNNMRYQFNSLNPESILHKAGYTVNAKDNISDYERWTILEKLIDYQITTKAEICSLLDYFINRSESRIVMSDAIEKWTKDRKHIAQYMPKELPEIEVISIHQG